MYAVKMTEDQMTHFAKGGHFLAEFAPKNKTTLVKELKPYIGKKFIIYPSAQIPALNYKDYFWNRTFSVEKIVDEFGGKLPHFFFEEDFNFIETIGKYEDTKKLTDPTFVAVRLTVESFKTAKKVFGVNANRIKLPNIQYRICDSIDEILIFADWEADKVEYAEIDLRKDTPDDLFAKLAPLSEDVIRKAEERERIRESIYAAKTAAML